MSTQSRSHLISTLAAIAVILAAMAGVGSLQQPRLQAFKTRTETASVETLRRDIEVERAQLQLLSKTPSFGFNNLLANWVFLRFLQYFGDVPARDRTDYRLSPEYFEVILARDPRFIDAYLFLSVSTSIFAAMPDRTVGLMNQGVATLSPQAPPYAYKVWRWKGIDELLFLGDGATARQSFIKAAEWARMYPDPESQQFADISASAAAFLTRNPDSRMAQIAAWTMVLSNAFDDRTRKIAVDRIEQLGGKLVSTPEGGFRIIPPAVD